MLYVVLCVREQREAVDSRVRVCVSRRPDARPALGVPELVPMVLNCLASYPVRTGRADPVKPGCPDPLLAVHTGCLGGHDEYAGSQNRDYQRGGN